MTANYPVDFLIVTPLDVELNAVLEKLPGIKQLPPTSEDRQVYYQTDLPVTFPDNTTGAYRVIVSCIGKGRIQAGITTAKAIQRWRPRRIVLVGIAGGISHRNVQLGDILIAEQIVDYESQKEMPEGPQLDWNVFRPGKAFVDACKGFMTTPWYRHISAKRPGQGSPNIHFGPVASGDKVFASKDALAELTKHWPKLLGVEMEAGAVAAIADDLSIPFLMVRAVSDHGDENKNTSEVERWRLYVCDVAATFAITLLKSDFIPVSEASHTAKFIDARLERYLPERLLKEYRSQHHDPATISSVTEHLTKLLEAVWTYRAPSILESVKAPPGHDHGQWMEATLLFAAVSGFGVMSERLSAKGRAGAEEIARVVDKYYKFMAEILHKYGGFVVKFGGDTLLAVFEGPAEDAAQNAVQAGFDMQREMSFLCNSAPLAGRLRVNVGIHAGRIFTAHIGNAEQMEYWIIGEAVNLAVIASNAASEEEGLAHQRKGQVVITETIARHLPRQTKFDALVSKPPPKGISLFSIPMPQGFRLLSSRPPRTLPQPPQDIASLVKQLDMVTPYLPPAVLSQINHLPVRGRSEGEHRLATAVLFINIEGLDQLTEMQGKAHSDLLLDTLQDYFVKIRTIVESHGGVINRTDLLALGHRILAVFGVPKAHEDDANQAASAALKIQAALVELNQHLAKRCPADVSVRLQQRIGLSIGDVFSSSIGIETCQQYTIVGDVVNVATWLMAAAPWGEIWVNKDAYLWLRACGDFELAGEPTVVGRSQGPAYRLLRIHKPFQSRPRFVDRENQLLGVQEQLLELSEADYHGRIVMLHGDRGIGKTHLWQQARVWADGQRYQYQYLQGHCTEHGPTYQVFAEILRQYLGLENTDDSDVQRDKLAQRIRDLFGPSDIPRRAPYLCNIMGLPLENAWKTEISLREDSQFRRPENCSPEPLATQLVEFLKKIMETTPLFIVCEDLHWINPDAATILEQLLDEVANMRQLMLGLSSCPNINSQYDELEMRAKHKYKLLTKSIDLDPLEPDHCHQIVEEILGDKIPEARRTLICQNSQGNPLFIVESSRNLLVNPEIEIPPNLQKVIESRIDALSEDERKILGVAAVIGDTFTIEEIEHVLVRKPDQCEVRQGILSLRNAHLITRAGSNFGFMHQLTREVIHQRQSSELQRRYYQHLGEYWAINGQPTRAADHYFAAELWYEALDWGKKAGDDCYTSYANAEGIRLCRQALQAAQMLQDTEAQIELCQRLGDLHYRMGKYAEALDYYIQQLQGLQATQASTIEQATVHCALGNVYERWGRYDQALRVLEDGLSLAGPAPSTIRARLLRVRCSLRCTLEQLEAAEDDGKQAVAVAAEVGPSDELAYAHNNLAKVYAQQELEDEHEQRGQYDLALIHHEEALRIRQSLGAAYDYEVAQSLENVGTQLCRLERLEDARPYYTQALEIQQRIGDPFGEGSVMQNWAWFHWDLEELDDAEEKFLRALELWTSIEYRKGQAYAQQDLGSLYKQQKQWEKALLYLEKATVLYKSLEIYNHLSETCLEQARVLKQLEQPARAREAAQRALEFAKKTRNEKKAQKLAQAAQTWLAQTQAE